MKCILFGKQVSIAKIENFLFEKYDPKFAKLVYIEKVGKNGIISNQLRVISNKGMEILILIPQFKKEITLIKKLYEEIRNINKLSEEESYSIDINDNIVVIKEAKLVKEVKV